MPWQVNPNATPTYHDNVTLDPDRRKVAGNGAEIQAIFEPPSGGLATTN